LVVVATSAASAGSVESWSWHRFFAFNPSRTIDNRQQLPTLHQEARVMLRTRRLVVLAVCVRVAYLAVALAATLLLPDYDTSAPLAAEECNDSTWPEVVAAAVAARAPPPSRGSWPPPAAASLGGRAARLGVVWDALFYQRISACGYEYEQYLAFFPGLPSKLMCKQRAVCVRTCRHMKPQQQRCLLAVLATAAVPLSPLPQCSCVLCELVA
jgi:hypothetical protein